MAIPGGYIFDRDERGQLFRQTYYDFPTFASSPTFIPFKEEVPTDMPDNISNNMYVTTSRPSKQDFDPNVLERVRAFLRLALELKPCTWPGYDCPVVINGVTHNVVAGSYFSKSGTKIYVGLDGTNPMPEWGVMILNGIIEWYCLSDEEDFSRKALQLFINQMANQARAFQRSIAQAFDGQRVVEIAVNTTSQQIAGRYEDEEGPVWRLPYSGEAIDITHDPNWFPLRMTANFLIA